MSDHTEELRKLWPVPKLTVLEPPDIVALLQYHFATCGNDHGRNAIVPNVSEFDFENEQFVCRHCQATEDFNIPVKDASSVDDYLCAMIDQGCDFNSRHFALCYQPTGQPS